MDLFEEISRSLRPHPSGAQILLEIEDERNNLEQAIRILSGNGGQPIKYDFMRKEEPVIVLFYLQTEVISESVLKLTEAGFNKIMAINSS